MTARSFNARNGLSVGTTPTEVVDSSGNITTTTLTATTGNITTLNVTGDLTVTGTTTYVNTTNLNVGDNIVTLNADVTGTPTENAGIEIRRGTSATTALRWNESSDVWEITQDGTNYGRIHSKLTDIVLGTDTSGNYVSTVNSGTGAITITGTASEGWGPTISIRSANTSVDGITQLVDSTANSSIIYAATANSVKTTYDLAYGRISAVDLATTANTVANKGILSLTPSTGAGAGTRDDVFFVGTGTSTISSNSTQITINSADQYTGTVTSVGSGNGLTGGAITTTGSLAVLANNGIVANSTGVFVNAGTGLVANATGVHMATVATAGSSTGGISAITIDAQGRVTSVTGSAGYITTDTNTTYDLLSVANTAANAGRVRLTASTLANDDILFVGSGTTVVSSNATQVTIATSDQYTGTVTSVGSGNGLTGGTITGSGTLSVQAGTGIVANATGVHVSLTDSTSSTSTTTAATPNSVKTAYDLAASKGTGTVTSVATGNGLTGGSITTTGTISVVANNGIVANATGVFVNAGNGLVANATGVHMASVGTAGSSTGGISAITVDTQGRVTSVTGSAGYLTSAVTSVTGGNGLTGSVTTTGSLAVGAGSGITVNADDVAVNAQSGLVANATGLYVRAGTAIVSNATGVHVSLTDSVSSTSTTTAATPNSVKTAYDLAASKGTGTVTSVGGTGTVNGITLSGTVTGSGNLTLGGSITAASTSTSGIVQLTDSVSSTSTTTAATPNSVKTAYDLANGKAATNQTMYIGTTAVAINRGSAAITLTGTNIDGSAGSVAWTNVSGRPTAVSSFTNDAGYVTSVGGPPDLSLRLKVSTGVSMSTNTSGVTRTTGFSTTERNLQNWTVSTSSTTGSFSDGYVTYYYTSYDSTTIILPAGSYYAEWFVTGATPYVATNSTITGSAYSYLYNVTDSSDIATGSGVQRMYNTYEDALSLGKGYFTLGASKTISVRQYAYTSDNSYGSWFAAFSGIDGMPYSTGEAATTTYAGLRIWKV